MLAHVMEIVEKDGNFDAVLLHVQINNDSAIKFYKRSGFDIVETKEQVCMQGCCAHRENQSAEAAAINTVCKPRRPAGGFFVSEFAPISLIKPFRKERCCLDSSILFGKVL